MAAVAAAAAAGAAASAGAAAPIAVNPATRDDLMLVDAEMRVARVLYRAATVVC